MPERRRTDSQTMIWRRVASGLVTRAWLYRSAARVKTRRAMTVMNARDTAFVSLIADTILPSAEFSGATNSGLGDLAVDTIRSCFSPFDQDRYTRGLRALRRRSFGGHDADRLLATLDRSSRSVNPDVRYFANSTRSILIDAFQRSEFVLSHRNQAQLNAPWFSGSVPEPTTPTAKGRQ